MENEQGVEQNSPSALANAIASSPEAQEEIDQNSDTQTPPAQQGDNQGQGKQQEAENAPFHKHPRFQELIEENRWLKQQVERSLQNQQAQQQLKQPVTSQTLPEEIGNTAEEREFWRLQRKIAGEEAERVAKREMDRLRPELDADRQDRVLMRVQQFRSAHPDIKPNSPEEIEIAQKVSMGYLPEDAYRAVMWDNRSTEVKNQVNQQIKQKIDAKRQANMEQSSIPNGASPPTNRKMTQRQEIEENARLLGI